MNEPNIKFLETLVKEAFECFSRGDNENGTAILNCFFDRMHPTFIEEAKNDKSLIYELTKAKNSKDEVESFSATAMLNYLKDRGVEL
tara:strand:+ start:309 stop:569 length:261 start_codon:yes stop_codon:yes gene_type:complete